MSSERTVIIENRTDQVLDLAVYARKPEEEGGGLRRRIKWVVRMGRSKDRDILVPVFDDNGRPTGAEHKIPNGVAVRDQSIIGKAGMVHSPIFELTPEEYAELQDSHNWPMLAGMQERNELFIREPVALPRRRGRPPKGSEQPAT